MRPKYKKSLDRWNKQTGGGDGTPPSFVDYCAGDRWLVYLFCKDAEANYLLASNAGGRMPKNLQVESGFEGDEVSSLEASNPSSGSKRDALEDELDAAKRQRQRLDGTLERMDRFIQQQVEKEGDERDKNIQKVAEYSLMLTNSNVFSDVTPNSKAKYTEAIKKQRKEYLDRLD